MKRQRRIRRWIPFILTWWLILFPEIVFCSGMCTAYPCRDGNEENTGKDNGCSDGEPIGIDSEMLWELLFRADPEQIEYKSFLWETLSQKVKDLKE